MERTWAQHICRVVPVLAHLICTLNVAQSALAGMPAIYRYPGEGSASTSTRWLAPFVQVTEIVWGDPCCGDGHAENVVRWYDPNGQEIFALSNVQEAREDYVVAGNLLYGTAHRWKHTLESREGWDSTLLVTRDSRFMLREFELDRKKFEVQLFDRGRLVGQYGAFERSWKGTQHYFAEDGHLVLSRATDDPSETVLMAILPNGAVSFETTVHGSFHVLAFNGTTLLVEDLKQIKEARRFNRRIRSFAAQGETSSFMIPGHSFCCWIPGSSRAVFRAFGCGKYLMVVDCFTGGVEWIRREETRVCGWSPATLVVSNLLLISSLEDSRPQDLPILTIRAFDVDMGTLVGRWHEGTRGETMSVYSRFVKSDEEIYWITPSEFSKISVDDIRNHRYGWKSE
jgi:hypothetical protein